MTTARKNKVLSISIPPQLLELVENKSIRDGLNRSDIIRRAIEFYFKSLIGESM